MLGDVTSRAPHIIANRPRINNLSIESIKFDLPGNFVNNNKTDDTFGNIYRHLNRKDWNDEILTDRMTGLKRFFYLENNLLFMIIGFAVQKRMCATYCSSLRTTKSPVILGTPRPCLN